MTNQPWPAGTSPASVSSSFASGTTAQILGAAAAIDAQRRTVDRRAHRRRVAHRHVLNGPGRAGVRERGEPFALAVAAARACADGDVVGALAGRGADRADVFGSEFAAVRSVEGGAVPARRPRRGAAMGIAAADPDRDPRFLDGHRDERDGFDLEALALMRERLAGPEPRDDLQAL